MFKSATDTQENQLSTPGSGYLSAVRLFSQAVGRPQLLSPFTSSRENADADRTGKVKSLLRLRLDLGRLALHVWDKPCTPNRSLSHTIGRLLPDDEKGNNFFNFILHLNAEESTLAIPNHRRMLLVIRRRVGEVKTHYFSTRAVLFNSKHYLPLTLKRDSMKKEFPTRLESDRANADGGEEFPSPLGGRAANRPSPL